MSDKHYVGKDLTGFANNGLLHEISRVTLIIDDEHYVTAGNDAGIEIQADCPFATQQMANAVLKSLKGYQYQTCTAESANLDPAAELGDGVTVSDVYTALSRMNDGGDGFPNISAPGESELQEEYPVVGPATQEFRQRLESVKKWVEENDRDLRLAVDNATQQITGNLGGYVVLHSSVEGNDPDEILVMDAPTIDKAKNVWRWNKSGLGHSVNGYNGPYGLAMTQDGAIVADYITTGILNASIIKAGTLSSQNGKCSINLDTGECQMTGTYTSEWEFADGDKGTITVNPGGVTFYLNGNHRGSIHLDSRGECDASCASYDLHKLNFKGDYSAPDQKVSFAWIDANEKVSVSADTIFTNKSPSGKASSIDFNESEMDFYTANGFRGSINEDGWTGWIKGYDPVWKTVTIDGQTITYLGR